MAWTADYIKTFRENVLRHFGLNTASYKQFLKPFQRSVFPCLINIRIGLRTLPAAQNVIETNNDRPIFWKGKNWIVSAVHCLHLWSDKLCVTLTSRSLKVYLLHVVLLHSKKEARCIHILYNVTIFAYKLVLFHIQQLFNASINLQNLWSFEEVFPIFKGANVANALLNHQF